MTSKEALEKLNIFISREKHINSEKNKIVNDCVSQIKQDLERLEVLELSNKTLDQICETQHEENEKLIKAIEIMKEHIHIGRNSCFYKVVLNGETELSLLDYELLKEVLE